MVPLLRRFAHRAPHINGRRGAFLLLWGFIYLLMGVSYFLTGRVPPALGWVVELVRPQLLGFLWVVPALFAISGCMRQRPGDAYAFAALVTGPVIWACLYIIGCFLTAEFTAILGVLVFCGLAGTYWIVAGMEGSSDLAERLTNPTEEP